MTHVLNLLFPQWQGAGQIPGLYSGALALHRSLGVEGGFVRVPVDLEPAADLAGSDLFARDQVTAQLQEAKSLIEAAIPDRIFMIGGDCGTEVAPISYLARKNGRDMAVIWLDAHPDLHTPLSSPSKTFHGMPLRALLGEGDSEILRYTGSAIQARQVFLCGVRDADLAELRYMEANPQISQHSVAELTITPDLLVRALKSRGFSKIYIHLDLDVLDPLEFADVPCPTPGGLSMQTLQTVVQGLASEFEIAGCSIVEHLAACSDDAARPGLKGETIAKFAWGIFQGQLRVEPPILTREIDQIDKIAEYCDEIRV